MTSRLTENNFGFGRRLRVDWSARSWRMPVLAAPPGAGVRIADDCRSVRSCRFQVGIFRQSCETLSRQTGQGVPGLKVAFRNLPRPRVNNSSTTEL